jgi:hypothetical protein
MLDLQKDYPEAALTFSGNALTAADVANAIVESIGTDIPELTLSFWRGVFAKTASARCLVSHRC